MTALPLGEFTAAERDTLARIEAAEPAPESLSERVAEALHAQFGPGDPWSEATPLNRDGFLIEAHVALDVVRSEVRS